MNKLHNNLTTIKNSFSGIRESFINNFGINYTNKAVSEYPNMLTDLITAMFPAKENRTSLTRLFWHSDIVKAPPINTSYVTDFSHMFESTYCLRETRAYNMSKAENLKYMYSGSGIRHIAFGKFGENTVNFERTFGFSPSLESVEGINSAKASTLKLTFAACKSITSISLPDMSECESIYRAFTDCSNLETIENFAPTSKMTQAGLAFLNCTQLRNIIIPDGSEICVSLDFKSCPFLTQESMISILNALSPNVSGKILYLGSAKQFLSDEEIAIATGKGWAVL